MDVDSCQCKGGFAYASNRAPLRLWRHASIKPSKSIASRVGTTDSPSDVRATRVHGCMDSVDG
eukprot:350556-Chlamydomonas_euryale.AAC.6